MMNDEEIKPNIPDWIKEILELKRKLNSRQVTEDNNHPVKDGIFGKGL